eukprot:gene1064-399_t
MSSNSNLPNLPVQKSIKDPFADVAKLCFERLRQIGQGSFGSVDYARYSDPNTTETMDVVVKRPINASGYEKEFSKEAHLLQSATGHKHIVQFKGVTNKPQYALMQEYIQFSFTLFDDDKIVNSLGEFLVYIDDAYDCAGFQHILPMARDHIVKGVSYLHSKIIVHKDLKPANIVDRGSPAYMAPEILLPEKRPLSVSLKDLMMFDVWAVGMICFVLANPCCKFPYALDIDAVIQQHKALDSQEVL